MSYKRFQPRHNVLLSKGIRFGTGVQLTEGMMMDPEASVSALVFHHPDCAYFTAEEGEAPAAPLSA